jgi:hypothetical protein
MATLLIDTSPRSTWITAPDAESSTAIRGYLPGTSMKCADAVNSTHFRDRRGHPYRSNGRGGLLLGAAYSFRWHADLYPLNRNGAARVIRSMRTRSKSLCPT